MFRIATKVAFRPNGLYRYPPHAHYPFMHASGASSTPQRKRTQSKHKTTPPKVTMEEDTTYTQRKQRAGRKYPTSYSRVRMNKAEERLGLRFEDFERGSIPIAQMLNQAKPVIEGLGDAQVKVAKEMVYDNIVRYLECEGYPTQAQEDFKEVNVNDLVFLIILPIFTEFKRQTGRVIYLRREKEIIAADRKTHGFQEFVVMDCTGFGKRMFVSVVESKKTSVGQGHRQCLLALKDMWDNNKGGTVYGFVTSGGQWQMLRYDHLGFALTQRFEVLSDNMEHDKEEWMQECGVIVDCIHMVLRSGGFVGA